MQQKIPAQLPPRVNQQRHNPNKILSHQTLATLLQLRHCWSITQNQWSNIPCWKRHPTINHTGHWQMGLWCLQDLHPKKPCPHSGVIIRPNRMLCFHIHPHFGCLIYLQTFSYYLQTFYFHTDFSRQQQTLLLHHYPRHEHLPTTWTSPHKPVPSFLPLLLTSLTTRAHHKPIYLFFIFSYIGL